MNNSKAFTLIELLVVIAIVGLLASIVLVSLQGAAASARDGKRDAEAGEASSAFRKTLEVYHSTHGNYPWNAASEAADGCCLESNEGIKNDLSSYFSNTLEDPLYDPGVSDTDPEKYCYRYKTINDGEDYMVKVLYERGGYKEISSWGGGDIAYEDPVITTFAKRFTNGIMDALSYIQQTADGGYISAGFGMSPFWDLDALVMRLDSDGNLLWNKYFNIDGASLTGVSYIDEVLGGGYIVIGDKVHPLNRDIYIMKLDADLDVVWTKTYGGATEEVLISAIPSEGGYILVGSTDSFGPGGGTDMLVVKIDSNGDQIWAKAFGSVNKDIALSITASGEGYILSGTTGSDVLVMKLNADGDKVWAKSFSSAADGQASILAIPGGGFILAGEKNGDVLAIKLDADGDQVWAKTYGGAGWDRSFGIEYTSTDGGCVIAGSTESFKPDGGVSSALAIKLYSSGNTVWARALSGNVSTNANESLFVSVEQVPSEGYIFAGHDSYSTASVSLSALFMKLDLDGNISSCPYLQDITEELIVVNTGDISTTAADSILQEDLGNIFVANGVVVSSSSASPLTSFCPE